MSVNRVRIMNIFRDVEVAQVYSLSHTEHPDLNRVRAGLGEGAPALCKSAVQNSSAVLYYGVNTLCNGVDVKQGTAPLQSVCRYLAGDGEAERVPQGNGGKCVSLCGRAKRKAPHNGTPRFFRHIIFVERRR